MVTKNDAQSALNLLNGIIDNLDWSGVFVDDELELIENYLSTLQLYINNSKEQMN